MKEFKIPTKLISMSKKHVYKRQEVWLEKKEQCHFFNKTGLKQADPLSPILLNLTSQKDIQSIKMVPSGIKIG